MKIVSYLVTINVSHAKFALDGLDLDNRPSLLDLLHSLIKGRCETFENHKDGCSGDRAILAGPAMDQNVSARRPSLAQEAHDRVPLAGRIQRHIGLVITHKNCLFDATICVGSPLLLR